MERDAFSKCHPASNFLFFLGAIGFGVVLQHPAYVLAGFLCGTFYHLLLKGRNGWRSILALLPLVLFVASINPLFNTEGTHVLFYIFGNPYTLEAFLYGAATGGILAVMFLWFGCYSTVLTSDKFISLFGSRIPSLSLLLVMVLRMIPNLQRKARQLLDARKSIGKGIATGDTGREKLRGGMTAVSALTDWALEGGIITADSMRSRGYGTAKRSSFRLYAFTRRDLLLLLLYPALWACLLLWGNTAVTFTPELSVPRPGWGLAAYISFLLIPTLLGLWEKLRFRRAIRRSFPDTEVSYR